MDTRLLIPELLDHLPASDPRAIRSRRDLIRVNAWMFNARLMSKLVLSQEMPVTRIVDLGSGDGLFALSVARLLAPSMPGVSVTLVDQKDVVSQKASDAFERLGWTVEKVDADVFEFLRRTNGYDLVTTNLFLHHFEGDALAELLSLISQKSRLLTSCEPARTPLALAGSRMLWAIGCNEVTRTDAVISVKAGFKQSEISQLWPEKEGWSLEESPAGLFTHTFTARRLS